MEDTTKPHDEVPVADADGISAAEAEPDMPEVTEAEAVAYGTPEPAEAEESAPEPEAPADPLALALEERDALRDQLLRHRAEFDNYRKRTARDMEDLRKTASQALIKDLLPVVDNLERALAHATDKEDPLVKGMEMVMKQFLDVLAARGVVPIAAVGEKFDPQHHEALANQPSDEHAEGVVVLEYERGYRIADQVLRPSRVVVSSGPASA